jgi:ribosome-interacting GTPase 1
MKITEKELSLIDDWVVLHREIEEQEEELETLSQKLKTINIRLYAKKQKVELEEFRDYLAEEIKRLNEKSDKDKIKQLTNLKTIIEHDINIENLVEQDIDIEERGVNIDLKDYKE